MERAAHWNRVYTSKGEREVSWFEPQPTVSLEMLEAAGMTTSSCVLDVGGGDSRLVDALTARGLRCLAVLDVSGAALERARARLGPAASIPTWIEADVTGEWTVQPMDIWHDRAVYARHLLDILRPGGHAIIATFGPDGPEKCSNLPVQRYTPESLLAALGPHVELVEARAHVHTTPWGSQQSFLYSHLRRLA